MLLNDINDEILLKHSRQSNVTGFSLKKMTHIFT